MGDMEGAFDKFRASPAYGPVGVLVAATVWKSLKVAMDKAKLPDCGELANCLLALMLSGVYIYSWTQGNPHDGEIQPNELAYEIPLLIAGGYYFSNMYPMSSPEATINYILSVTAVIAVILSGSGANVASTFGFLTECPTFAFTLLTVLQNKEAGEEVLSFFGLVHAMAFAFARVLAAGYTVFILTTKDEVSTFIKILSVLLYLSALLSAGVVIKNLCGSGDNRKKKRGCARSLHQKRVYMSTWMTEGNPHDAHVTENQLGEEIPLLVIAGYYAASCFPVDSAASLLYRLLSVIACLVLIYSGSGANVANTFVFLVEAPAAFISTRILMAKRSPPRENNAACSVVFFLTRVSSLTYLTVRILVQDQIPLHMKGAVLLLSILTLTFVPKLFESCCGEKRKASYTNPNGATRQHANTGGIKGKQK